MTRNNLGIILALFLYTGTGCKHLPKVEPGSISLHLSGETAEVMRKVMGHTAVSPSRYITFYLIGAAQVTPYLECHEGIHTKVQAVRYENDVLWVRAYYGESIRSAWISIQEDFKHDPGRYINLVMRIVRNEVDLLALTKEEGERLIQMAYWNNRFEKEAREACEHLRRSP